MLLFIGYPSIEAGNLLVLLTEQDFVWSGRSLISLTILPIDYLPNEVVLDRPEAPPLGSALSRLDSLTRPDSIDLNSSCPL
jgi:hypothetical protein